jgi:fibronectin type 3 domain-containing protein
MGRTRITALFLLTVLLLLCTAGRAFSQQGPLAFILPAGDSVVVVLGDTPRLMHGFRVYRQDPGRREFELLTPDPLRAIADPYQAAQMMGPDFRWVAKKVGSLDPPLVWRKLMADRDQTLALCLVSHGLRKAMGRTFIDATVAQGTNYLYRVELLDMYGQVIERIDKRIQAGPPEVPEAPRDVKAEAGEGQVSLSWSYRPYRNRADDLTVGFRIYRQESGGRPVNLTTTPVLRIEGWLSYIDTEVENGKTYTYQVEAVDMIGAASPRRNSLPVTPTDTRAPLVPSGLRGVDSEEGVLLLWRLSPDLDLASYNVLRSGRVEGEYQRINPEPVPGDQARYLDREVIRGTSYYYRVTAVDSSGNESAPCGPTSVLPADSEPPPELSGLQAEVDPDKRGIILHWNRPEIPDLQGYFVYRESIDSQGQEGKAMRLNADPLPDTEKPAFADSGYKERGLAPGGRFRYGVSAVDSSYNEGPIVFVEAAIPDKEAPKAPVSISARSTEAGTVRLRWQPGLEKDLSSHRIYRKEDRSFAVVAELERNRTEWIDTEVRAGKAYRYYITELDSSGNESEPSREVEVIPGDIVAPDPPLSLEIRAERRGFRLTWQPSPSEDAAGYLIYRSAYAGAPWRKLTRSPIKETSFVDRQGQAGNLYGIAAVDSSGNEGSMAVITAEAAESASEESPR